MCVWAVKGGNSEKGGQCRQSTKALPRYKPQCLTLKVEKEAQHTGS